MANHWITCPNCGEKRNASGDYTSPANYERDSRLWREMHRTGLCTAMIASAQASYRHGELRLVRLMAPPVMDNVAYAVQETSTSRNITSRPLTEQDAMLVMRNLCSPYEGTKYDDHIWRTRDERNAQAPAQQQPSELQLFTQARTVLDAASANRSSASFREGEVRMPLGEYQHLAQILKSISDACDAIEYKVPGKHETWDDFHEGRDSLADEISSLLQLPPSH